MKLAGDIDEGNPDSLKADEISGLCCDGQIEWLGYQSNIKEFWNDCHVAMLGSHGGEGLPMSLLIPAAMGRPIICSDTSGNRDLVIDGENGHLFPAGDIDAIMETVRMIIKDDLSNMGVQSHKLIFDRGMDADAVHRQFMALYAG